MDNTFQSDLLTENSKKPHPSQERDGVGASLEDWPVRWLWTFSSWEHYLQLDCPL